MKYFIWLILSGAVAAQEAPVREVLFGVVQEEHCVVRPLREAALLLPWWGGGALVEGQPDGSYLAILAKGSRVLVTGENGDGRIVRVGRDRGTTKCAMALEYVVPPRAVYDPNPEYSYGASRRGVRGTVTLAFTVGEDGRPRDIAVIRPLQAALDANAVAALGRWRFEPARRGGKAVAVPLTVDFKFDIE
jgi:TonB family protein